MAAIDYTGTIIADWKTNPNENTMPAPLGAPEGMQPSYVNNVMRRIMAGTRELADKISAAHAALGTMAAQNANAVAITDGSANLAVMSVPGTMVVRTPANAAAAGLSPIALANPWTIAQGGTGATTAAAALNALGVNNYARMGDLWMANAVFPRGLVTMWVGRPGIDPVPFGFGLCSGAAYTSPLNGDVLVAPNMYDRFPVAAGNVYSVGQTGGAAQLTVATNEAGGHSHFGATRGHALTIDQMPSHSHAVPGSYWNSSGIGASQNVNAFGGGTIFTGGSTANAGNGNEHGHAIDVDGAHAHSATFDNRPPYYAISFVMKL